MSAARSSRPDVRNPVAALYAVQRLRELDPVAKRFLKETFDALSYQCRENRDRAWKQRKPPMAAYWASFAVNWRHLSAVIRPPGVRQVKRAEDAAMAACRELIFGDGSNESLQRTIDLANQAVKS